jgi:hypothetical protein
MVKLDNISSNSCLNFVLSRLVDNVCPDIQFPIIEEANDDNPKDWNYLAI